MDDRVTDIKDRLAKPSGGVNIDLVIVVIFTVDFLVIFALIAVLSPTQALWVVPLVIGAPFAIFVLINLLLWNPLSAVSAAPRPRRGRQTGAVAAGGQILPVQQRDHAGGGRGPPPPHPLSRWPRRGEVEHPGCVTDVAPPRPASACV